MKCASAYWYDDIVIMGNYTIGHGKRQRQLYTKFLFALRAAKFKKRESIYTCFMFKFIGI
jgi:hypothetical protein